MSIYRNYINGQLNESQSDKAVENINPANTDNALGTIKLSTREEARALVEAAAEAFRLWRKTPAHARGKIVARFAQSLERKKESVAQLYCYFINYYKNFARNSCIYSFVYSNLCKEKKFKFE